MIDTGAVEDIGYVAEAEEQRQATINHLAHDHIKEKEFFALVKDAIVHAPDISGQGQVLTSLKVLPNKPLPFWANDPSSRTASAPPSPLLVVV